MTNDIKSEIIKELKKLSEYTKKELIEKRYDKYRNIGEFNMAEGKV